MTEISDLITRVEGASGADRELDARLYVALIGRLKMGGIEDLIAERARTHPGENVWLDAARDWRVAPYTASVDAALSLLERVLPGWFVGNICQTDHGHWYASITEGPPSLSSTWVQSKTLPTPALALVLAILKTKAV